MGDVEMSLKLAFGLEGHVALGTAGVIGAHKMGSREVDLQLLVIVVPRVFVIISAKVTRQMHTMEMLTKFLCIVEELLTEVAPWMWQDFGTRRTGWVTIFNMLPKLLQMVDSLFSNEYGASLETHQAECLLMDGLHVASQTLLIREVLPRIAVSDEAVEISKFHTLVL